jgi:FkbM family methyltransferase
LARFVFQRSHKELMSIAGDITFQIEGQAFTLRTNQTCFVTKYMFYNGLDAYEYNWIFPALSKQARSFLDVGANIGLYSVMAAKLNPKLEIHAFEPGKGAVHFLRENCRINQLDQVHIHELAMSDTDTEAYFHEAGHPKFPWLAHNLNGSSSLQAAHGRQKAVRYPVQVQRLSSFLNAVPLPHIDLIKLDTEHTEQLILADNRALISEHQPVIMIEVYPEVASEIQTQVQQWPSYRVYQLQKRQLVQIACSELGLSTTAVNYLLVPEAKQNWIAAYCS